MRHGLIAILIQQNTALSRNQFMKLNAPIMAWLRDQPDLPSDDVSKMALAIEAGVTLYAGYGSGSYGYDFYSYRRQINCCNILF